jgi:hypothetical protein
LSRAGRIGKPKTVPARHARLYGGHPRFFPDKAKSADDKEAASAVACHRARIRATRWLIRAAILSLPFRINGILLISDFPNFA